MEIVIAGISIFGAVAGFALTQRAAARDRQREEYAKALQTITKWTELPWRVHRRPNDNVETRLQLVERMHALQEELAFYDAWISVDAPVVATKYRELIGEVKRQVAPHLQTAWNHVPASEEPGMNIGNLYPVDIGRARQSYIHAVRNHLKWFGLWERMMSRLEEKGV